MHIQEENMLNLKTGEPIKIIIFLIDFLFNLQVEGTFQYNYNIITISG